MPDAVRDAREHTSDEARAAPGPRVALVTGGNRGIGREVGRQLAARGDHVVLGARDLAKGEDAARALARELGPAARVSACALDVADDASVAEAARWLERSVGRLDVLVNNAAINYDTRQRAIAPDFAAVRATLETNTFGPWRVTVALAPLLRRAGRGGRVVNVSSEAGSLTGMRSGGTPAYAVSKAALNAVTRLLAAELARDGVLVNAVCPGWVATDMGGAGGRPVADGAASVLWAATLPDGGPTGGFYRDGRPLPW